MPNPPASKFPAQIDDGITLPKIIDGLNPINAAAVNILRNAIIGIEANIGVGAQGSYSNIAQRLNAIAGGGGGGGGGSGFTAAGDLSGTATNQRVIGLYSIPLSSTTPTTGQFLGYNGFGWIPENIHSNQISPSYEVILFGPSFVEVGLTIFNPLFTATYSATPSTATFIDNQGNPSLNVLAAPAPSTSAQFFYGTPSVPIQYTSNTYGASVLFTLTSTLDTSSATSTSLMTWTQNVYYGAVAAGTITSAFVTNLPSKFLSQSRNTTFTVFAAPGQYIYYAYRAAYGAASIYAFGWSGGFSLVSTIAVTNTNGFTENYNIYQSDYSGLGLITASVF